MTTSMTYGELERVLKGLGFQTRNLRGTHCLYDHADTGAGFILPQHKELEPVRETDFRKVRRTLVEFGVVEENQVAALLSPQPVAV